MTHFETQIKTWVNLDNQLLAANAAVKTLRQERNAAEEHILQHVDTNHLHQATISISDGRLRFVTTKETAPLTLKYVETCLHKKVANPALVQTIMEEIRQSRPVKESWDIKRSYKN